MTEKPAKQVRGFFLYSPLTERHFFRIYGEKDPVTGRKPFTDYKVCAEDIEVTIEAGGLSLYEVENGDEEKNRLDWSSTVLGKNSIGRKKDGRHPTQSPDCPS